MGAVQKKIGFAVQIPHTVLPPWKNVLHVMIVQGIQYLEMVVFVIASLPLQQRDRQEGQEQFTQIYKIVDA